MIQASKVAKQSVLIVDRSADSREVIRTVLQRRGVQIYEATEARAGLALAQQFLPTVILLDLECEAADDPAVRDGYQVHVTKKGSAMVMLGTARGQIQSGLGSYVRKPYHYGPLIRTIEQLIES